MAQDKTYGLYLSQVRICNFRTLKDVTVQLERKTTILIGENNSGKTNFLQALEIAFGRRKPKEDDFHKSPNYSPKTFSIFLHIKPSNNEEFDTRVHDAVREGIEPESFPEYFIVRVTAKQGENYWDILIKRVYVANIENDQDDRMRGIVTQKALELLYFDLLDARRDIVEELRNKYSYWGRVLSKIKANNEKIKEIKDSIAKANTLILETDLLNLVTKKLNTLSEGLGQNNLKIELETLPQEMDNLVRSMDINLIAPNSNSFSITQQGMGTRTLSAILVFSSYMSIIRQENSKHLLAISAFEEPEAHLHPNAQRSAFKLLEQIKGQCIISTHSTYIISKLSAYRVFRRIGAHTQISAYSPKSLQENIKFERYIQRENPEILFARCVIIVEGETEKAMLSEFANEYWNSFSFMGISIISANGVGNIQHFVFSLEEIKIPWIVFCDGDQAGNKAVYKIKNTLNANIESNHSRIIQLPDPMNIEDYLTQNEKYYSSISNASDIHEQENQSSYKARISGSAFENLKKKARKNNNNKYKSTNWKSHLARDFMTKNKGTIGRLIAEEIIKTFEKSEWPDKFIELFKKTDEVLQKRDNGEGI